MSEYTEAASAASKLTGFIEMLERVRTVVAKAAQFEQEEQAAKDRVKVANEAAVQAEGKRKAALTTLTTAEAQVTATQGRATDLERVAKDRAAQIVLEAQIRADGIETRAKEALTSAQVVLANAQDEARKVSAQTEAARVELAAVQEQIEAAKADARARFG